MRNEQEGEGAGALEFSPLPVSSARREEQAEDDKIIFEYFNGISYHYG